MYSGRWVCIMVKLIHSFLPRMYGCVREKSVNICQFVLLFSFAGWPACVPYGKLLFSMAWNTLTKLCQPSSEHLHHWSCTIVIAWALAPGGLTNRKYHRIVFKWASSSALEWWQPCTAIHRIFLLVMITNLNFFIWMADMLIVGV